MRITWLLIFLISSLWKLNAQSLPKVIPPSPETSALFRFLDYPVNHSTGVPEISVPLFNIKSGSLSTPISISYHAGGRRVSDKTGPVGLGWSLNAGGMVSRVVHGMPDDQYSFPPALYPAAELSNKDDYEYLKSFQLGNPDDGLYDSEHDIYSYYFGSQSGKFVLNNDHDSVFLMPQKPLKIPVYSNNFPGQIIDEKGIEYNFGLVESYHEGGSFNAVTGALLTSIISPDRKDTISFSYTSFSQLKSTPTETYTLVDDNSTGNPNIVANTYFSTISTNTKYYTIWRLTEINFREGKLKFNLQSGTDRVSSIQLIRKDGTVLKTAQLQLSLLDQTDGESNYKLDELIWKDQNNVEKERYSFAYYPSSNHSAFSKDYWGYLNSSNQTHGVPYYNNVEYLTPPGGSGTRTVGSGANRNADGAAQNGVLKKITYPTGGSTEFVFELNKLKKLGTEYYCGGIRVKEIITTDNIGATMKKNYTYGVNESGHGIKTFFPVEMQDLSYETRTFPGIEELLHNISPTMMPDASYRTRIYSSEFLPEIAEMHNEPIFYPEVAEYNGTPAANTGKTVYKYESPANGASNHYATYFYRNYPGYVNPYGTFTYSIDIFLPRLHIYQFNYWQNNALLEQAQYRNNGNNTYKLVRKTINGYTSAIVKTLKGLHLLKYLNIPENSSYPGANTAFAASTLGLPVYIFGDYEITIGKKELTSTIVIDSTDNSRLQQLTTYTYNSHQLVEESRQTTSKGNDTLITRFKYPFDYLSTPVYQSMDNLNMLDYKIEQSTFRSTTHLSSTKTNFANWPNSIIAPSVIETKQGANSYESRLRYHSYDAKGNILTVSKENDAKNSYIWDYANTYPIAEVINSSTGQSAYTSFEADGWGGWTMNPGSVVINNYPGITGRNTISGGVQKTVPAGNYVVSFWSIANSWLNGQLVTYTPVKIVGPWRYYEITLNNISSINVAGDNIDEIRLYPVGAQMTTYTYDPLIGVTSQCDANNRITYYEYDSFARLLRIQDENKNIIKQFDYQYQASTNNNPIWQANGITRCKPCDQNAAYTTNILQNQEINTNPNITVAPRWVDVGTSSSCGLPDWVNTTTPVRCRIVNGQNTGEQEQEQKDLNNCSSTFNQTRWIVVNTNTTACPVPCNSSNCSGNDKKCVNGICETGGITTISSVWKKVVIDGAQVWKWECTHKYCFSDGSASTYSWITYHDTSCTVSSCAID